MRPSIRRLKLVTNQFGTYDLLVPPRRPPVQPLPRSVPQHIVQPPYVASNFFSRRDGESLVSVDDGAEGWDGEPDVGSTERGRINLGGADETGVRFAGRLVAEIMSKVKDLIVVRLRILAPSVSTSPFLYPATARNYNISDRRSNPRPH